MTETAAQKRDREAKARSEAEANTAADTPGEMEIAPTSGARNVLTVGMPQPPGVRERRSRRSRRKERTGPFVKYVGNASHRVIRASDWGQLGFEGKEAGNEFLWGPKNDYMIESSKFSDEQLDYMLIDDIQPGGGHAFLEVDFEEDDDGNRQLVQVVDDDE